MQLLAAVDLLLALIDRGRAVSEVIKKARAENRTDISEAELDLIAADTTKALTDAKDAIARAKARGR